MPNARVELERTANGWIGAVEAPTAAGGRRTIAFPDPRARIETFEAAMRRVIDAYTEITGEHVDLIDVAPPAAERAPRAPRQSKAG